MSTYKAPTLNNLAKQRKLLEILIGTIHDLLGIKGQYVLADIENKMRGPWLYIFKLSKEISDTIYKEGLRLAAPRVRRFKDGATLLNSDEVEDIWMQVSRTIGQKMDKVYEIKEDEDFSIPGLKEYIESSTIEPMIGSMADRVKFIEEEARCEILARLPAVNHQAGLLAMYQNNLFSFFQKEYGVFSEPANELAAGENRV